MTDRNPSLGVRSHLSGSLVAAVVLVVGMGAGALVGMSPAAAQTGSDLFAYATGIAAPTGCPSESDPTTGCSLENALSQADAGDAILLATPGASGSYLGNWTISTAGTSPEDPLSIEAAPGTLDPTLSGNNGNSSGCTTDICDNSILDISGGVSVTIDGITFENAHNAYSYDGGGIDTGDGVAGGTVSVSDSTFTDDYSTGVGGAIDNAQYGGSGTLIVSDSTFTSDSTAYYGGAIDNSDQGGDGTATITDSVFNGDDTQIEGGAIASADNEGVGTLTISGSAFNDDWTYESGGAIEAGFDGGPTTTSISDSTFNGNYTGSSGGAIDTGDASWQGTSTSTMSISDSTFDGNSVIGSDGNDDGGAIDNADQGGSGVLSVSDSTFSENSAPTGGTIDTADGGSDAVAVAADIFDGTCSQSGGTWDDEGYNVGLDASCLAGSAPSDMTDPSLGSDIGSLAYNGGPTETILPIGSNPGIGLVPSGTSVTLNGASVALCPTTDERGVSSLSNQPCDSGALQDGSPTLSISAITQNIPYGASPNLTPHYSGFVLTQAPSSLGADATCVVDKLGTTTPYTKSPVRPGTYTINCSGAEKFSADEQNQPDTSYAFSYQSGTLTVQDTKKPVNVKPPTLSGDFSKGGVVVRVPGAWVGPKPMTFSFQWEVCTTSATASCTAIPGATNPSYYTLTKKDVGKFITIKVTATDPQGKHGYVTATPIGPITESDVA